MIFDTIHFCLVIAKPCRLDIHPVGILGIQERVLSAEKSHAPFTSINCVFSSMLLTVTLLHGVYGCTGGGVVVLGSIRVAANQRRKTVIPSSLLCSLSTVGLKTIYSFIVFISSKNKYRKHKSSMLI